jgi:protein gp37
MAENSKIEWTDHTFNPWMGCTKVSPACANCYAERDFDHRYGKVQWGPTGTRVITSDSNWQKPLQWNRKAESLGVRYRVFCASLADVFEDWKGPIHNSRGKILNENLEEASNSDMHNDELLTMDHIRRKLFALIDQTSHLDWLLLTKRPENIRRMWWGNLVTGFRPFRRDNVWLGASVESADYLGRIDTLKTCGDLASVLFLSCEPVVGPMPTLGEHIDGIDWIITGGESGPEARPADPDWFRSIRDQCEAHNVPFHFKQWGEFDENQVRVGKKNAGRLLDGVTHDGLPIVQTV